MVSPRATGCKMRPPANRPPFRRGVAEGLPFIVIMVPFGALFGVLPARRATRLDPVAALAGR